MSEATENNARIAKNTLMLYFRMFIIMAVGLYTSRVILNTLGVEDYGIYNVVGSIVAMFTFVNSAMSSATSRFLTFALGEGNFTKLRKTFSVSITVHLLIALLVILLAETIGLWFFSCKLNIPAARQDAAMWVFQLSILSTVVSIMSVPFNSSIIAHEKMSAFAYISISDAVLKLLIVYLLSIVSFDKLKVYAVLLFFGQCFNQIIYMIYCFKKFPEVTLNLELDKRLFYEMFSFASWSLLGNIAYVTYTQGLNMLLNVVFGPAVNAARGIAVQVQVTIYNFVNNFQTAINPQLVKSYATGDWEYQRKLICYSSKLSFFLLCILAAPVFLEAPYILRLWLVQVPEHTVNFVRIMLFISLIDTLSIPIFFSIGATGKVRMSNIIVSSILIAILPISWLLLKMNFPAESVFIVHLSCAILAQIARIIIFNHLTGFSIRYYLQKVISPSLFVLLLISIAGYIIISVFPNENFINLLTVCLLSVIWNLTIIYFGGLGTYERSMVKGYIKTALAKFYKK